MNQNKTFKYDDMKQEKMRKQLNEEGTPYSYNTREYPIEVLVKKYIDGEIIIPQYQRNLVWKDEMQTRFIESLLLGVPIMPMLVAEIIKFDKKLNTNRLLFEVVDGTQRLRTLERFINNELKLKKLEKLTEFEGIYFKNLELYLQGKFQGIDIRIQIVTDKADDRVRADIFNRINTGGKKLSPSEIRKGSFAGKCYDLVQELAKDKLFHQLCPVASAKHRGEREELVLRYIIYSKYYLNFKHDVTKFLDEKLVQLNSDTTYDPEKDKNQFKNMLEFVKKYFPSPYFTTDKRKGSTARVRFEAISVGVHLAIQTQPDLVPSSMEWLYSEDFLKETTTDASNNPGRLKSRIEFVRDSLLCKK